MRRKILSVLSLAFVLLAMVPNVYAASESPSGYFQGGPPWWERTRVWFHREVVGGWTPGCTSGVCACTGGTQLFENGSTRSGVTLRCGDPAICGTNGHQFVCERSGRVGRWRDTGNPCGFLVGQSPESAEPAVDSVPIRVGVLGVPDSLPVYMAVENGLFPDDIKVELVYLSGAGQRDSMIQQGKLDIIATDMVSAALLQGRVKVFRTNRTGPSVAIVASSASGISSINDVSQVATQANTYLHYMTNLIMQHHGIAPVIINIPRVTDRMVAINSGEIDAASMSVVLARVLERAGAVYVIDDSSLPRKMRGISVWAARSEFLAAHPNAVASFVGGVHSAVYEINQNRYGAANTAKAHNLIPAEASANVIGNYSSDTVPSRYVWNEVTAWMEAQGLRVPVRYEDVVTHNFVP